MRVTLSVTLLPNQELPGSERAQIWVWARPLNADDTSVMGVRRVALSPEASCLSFGEYGLQHPARGAPELSLATLLILKMSYWL